MYDTIYITDLDLHNQCVYTYIHLSLSLYIYIYTYICINVVFKTRCRRSPHFAHMFPWKLIIRNRGTSVTTPFVPTPAGSCQLKLPRGASQSFAFARRCPRCVIDSARDPPRSRHELVSPHIYIYI